MIEQIATAAILCIVVAGGTAWLVWVGRNLWRKHMAKRRRHNSVVGIGESVTHRLPALSVEDLILREEGRHK